MIKYCQNSEVLGVVLSILEEYFGSVISIGEFEILVNDFGSSVVLPVNYWKRIILLDYYSGFIGNGKY